MECDKVELNQIKPKEKGVSDKYSWQLYNYFKKNKFNINSVKVIFDNSSWFDSSYVEFNKEDLNTMQIWIGYVDSEGWILGNSLNSIIGSSNKKYMQWANPWVKQHEHIDITEWFWNEYIKIGRCIWDKPHNGWLMDDKERFEYIDEDTRKCNWCGLIQHKSIREEIKKFEVWS